MIMAQAQIAEVQKKIHALTKQFDEREKWEKTNRVLQPEFQLLREDFFNLDRYLKDQKNRQDSDIFDLGVKTDRVGKRVFEEEKPILQIVEASLGKTELHLNSHLEKFSEKQEEQTFVVQQKHQDIQFQVGDLRGSIQDYISHDKRNYQIAQLNEKTVFDFEQRLSAIVNQRNELSGEVVEFRRYKEQEWREHTNN